MASQIFICYARRDFPFVRDLARSLTAQGVKVWFDVLDMSAGENYVREIDAAIAASDCVAVVVSPYSMASPECQREIKAAAAMNKRTVPVLLQAAVMPEGLRVLQWIDFRRDYEQPLVLLLAFIRGESKPMAAALALDALPRPLNVGDKLALGQLDCPVLVKSSLLLIALGTLVIFGLSMKFTFDAPAITALGLAYYSCVLVVCFLAARRRLTFSDALSLGYTAVIPLLLIWAGWSELITKRPDMLLLVLAEIAALSGTGLMFFSKSFRRWMVAYSHEPGQDLITNPFKRRRTQQNQ